VKQAALDEGLRSDGLTTTEREGLNRLRRENRVLRKEREIQFQKPRPGSLRNQRDAVAAFAFVGANQAMHPIASMCRVLGVSPGGYYARLKLPPSVRVRADVKLSARIAAIHHRSRATYGAPPSLRSNALVWAAKRVARLMGVAGLRGISRRNSIITTVRDRDVRPAPDLVERNFTAVG
jgi:hypothetical protein